MTKQKTLLKIFLIVLCIGVWGYFFINFPELELPEDAPTCKELSESETDSQLLLAADAGCFRIVRTLEAQSIPLPVSNQATRLLVASITGDLQTVQKLFRKGVDVNILDSDPFGYACYRGHLDVVKEFIKAGANVNAQDGWPLQAAASKGHLAVVQELIKAGADVNLKDKSGLSPLNFAAHNGRLDVVKELIKSGADVNEGVPLGTAARDGHLDVVQELIKSGANVNPAGELPLLAAAYNGHLDIVKELIESGAKLNAEEPGVPHYTAWVAATGRDHPEIAKELERAGAKVDHAQKNVALQVAGMEGNLEVVKKLLAAGADPTWRNAQGRTARMIAAGGGHADVVTLLRTAEKNKKK